MRIDPKEISTPDLHAQLLGCIGPRPIALASTLDEEGNPNLAPYSFFNVFSTNPPTLILSPAKPRDLVLKHTLLNAMATKEIVINIVNYPIVEQMSLSSTAYAKGINEFVKSGLTAVDSEMVKAPRVGESIASFECKVKEVVHLGEEAGAGNLIICEILFAHISDDILGEDGKPDPYKTDLVARMGGDWYCRASGNAIFKLPKPNKNLGIGVDQIPDAIRNSVVLTGNNLGRLGNIDKIPENDRIFAFSRTVEIEEIKSRFKNDLESYKYHLHQLAKRFLEEDELQKAWLTLLQDFSK